MAFNEDCRRRAQLYLGLAKACSDPDMADRLRAIAADYFDLAGNGSAPAVQQQQQIQPDKDTE
jgi:hypothetical protein